MAYAPLQKLGEQHKLFVKAYIGNGFNGAAAYREVCGDRVKDIRGAASKWVRDPLIQEEIRREVKERCKELQINEDRVLLKLGEMAFADKEDEYYGPSVQLKAIDLLQKQLGLQKQNIKADVDQTTTINVTIEED